MDYVKEAIDYLRYYNDFKVALDSLRYEILEIDAELKNIKAIDSSGMPHGSGAKSPDDILVNKVYRKQEAQKEYKLTKLKLDRLDKALNNLSEGKGNELQEEIVRYMFIDHKSIDQVKKMLQGNPKGKELSDRQIYRIRDRGIRRMAIRFFGIKGFGE